MYLAKTQERRDFLRTAIGGASGLAAATVTHAASTEEAPAGIDARVQSLEVIVKPREPKAKPNSDAIQTLPGIGQVIVQITATNGVQGTGEISYGRIAGALQTLKSVIDNELKPVVLGTELRFIGRTYQAMVRETDYHGTLGLATLGIAAVDTALWDCLGRTLEVPCWQLWGGCHTKLPTYAMAGWLNFTAKEVQAVCEKAVQQGYRAIKVKVGYPTLEQDVQRLRTVREVVGEDIRLMVDANQALTVGEAISRGKAFEDLGCYWFEEPIPAQNVEGYRRISEELRIQLATGENLFGSGQFALFIKRDAVDIIQPDLRRAGGPTALLEIGRLANSFGVPYASHGGGTPVHLNVMASLPNTIYVETGGTSHLVDGMIEVPQGPGFSWE